MREKAGQMCKIKTIKKTKNMLPYSYAIYKYGRRAKKNNDNKTLSYVIILCTSIEQKRMYA